MFFFPVIVTPSWSKCARLSLYQIIFMIPISHICNDSGEKSAYADYGYIGKELRLLLIQEEVP